MAWQPPPTDHIQAALAVARHHSFTRAAEELGLSQPALSRQIARLEKQLGVRLFDRIGRNVRPTPAGDQFIRKTTPLLEELARLASFLSPTEGTAVSRVRLGTSESLAIHVLPPILAAYRKTHRRGSLQVRCHPSDRLAELVLSGELDLAIATLDEDPTGLTVTRLWTEDIVLVLPSGHSARSRSITSYRHEPFLLPATSSTTRRLIDRALASKGISLTVTAEYPEFEVVKAMVRAGLGISLLPESAVRAETHAGTLAAWPLADCSIRRPIAALADPRRVPWPAEIELMDALKGFAGPNR